jgi:hypothetical protein
MEEGGRGAVGVLFRHLTRGTEEKHENLSHDSRCPDRGSNRPTV